MRRNQIPCILILAFAVLFVAGCAEKNPNDTILVKGIVKVDGQPTQGVTVTFAPSVEGGQAAYGVTNDKGEFALTTTGSPVGTGALAGTYVPTFVKTETEKRPPTSSPEEELEKYKGVPAKVTYLVPQKYGNAKTCGMTPVTVAKGNKDPFNFELSTKTE